MNKKLLASLAVSLLLVLSACAPATEDEEPITPPENEVVEDDTTADVETDEEDEVEEDEVVETEKTETELQEEFVRETFAEYDYEAPEYSAWEVKEEGPEKIAVIIKEDVADQDKPNISKVIYLWEGSKETAKVLHVTVENNDVYNGN